MGIRSGGDALSGSTATSVGHSGQGNAKASDVSVMRAGRDCHFTRRSGSADEYSSNTGVR